MLTTIDDKLLAQAVRAAKEAGAEFAEAYYEHSRIQRLSCEKSILSEVVTGTDRGVGLRAITGDRTGYTYTDDLSLDGLVRAARQAAAVAKGEAAPHSIAKNSGSGITFAKKRPSTVNAQEKADKILKADRLARQGDSKIVQVIVNYGERETLFQVINSLGTNVKDEKVYTSFSVTAVAFDGTRIETGRCREGYHIGFELFDRFPVEYFSEEAVRLAVLLLSAPSAPRGRMPVVIAPSWGGVLIHEACGHGLEEDHTRKGLSVFGGKMNERLASEIVTIVDDGTYTDMQGTINYDDEGTPAKRNVLIEKGILKGYMTDIASARHTGTPLTGNGRRQSFRFPPQVRMTNTFIDQGDMAPEEIIAQTDSGLYVTSLGGGQVDTATGEFVFTVNEGYLIENGKKTNPVRGATLVGSGLEVLQNIDKVGNDLALDGGGYCGKMGQMVPVSVGQPTVRVKSLVVGGQ